MANVTATTAAYDIDEAWTPELNRAIEMDIVIAALFEDKSKLLQHGNKLNMPSRHNLTANTKSATVDLTPEAITETEQEFTVSTHQAIAQKIEDFAEVQSKYDLRNETTMAGSYALARAMDVACAGLFNDNTLQVVGAYGSELSYDNMLDSRAFMRNSPVKGEQYVMISPKTWNGLLKVDNVVNQLYNGDTGGKALHEGQLGKIFQATIYESQLLEGTAPSSSGAWWVKPHFFKIVQRSPTTHTWYDPLALAWVVSMDQIYGVFERQEADEAAAATTNARLGGVHLKSIK